MWFPMLLCAYVVKIEKAEAKKYFPDFDKQLKDFTIKFF